jgi:hypothetical protein
MVGIAYNLLFAEFAAAINELHYKRHHRSHNQNAAVNKEDDLACED